MLATALTVKSSPPVVLIYLSRKYDILQKLEVQESFYARTALP